jgi:hypothetical protein
LGYTPRERDYTEENPTFSDDEVMPAGAAVAAHSRKPTSTSPSKKTTKKKTSAKTATSQADESKEEGFSEKDIGDVALDKPISNERLEENGKVVFSATCDFRCCWGGTNYHSFLVVLLGNRGLRPPTTEATPC